MLGGLHTVLVQWMSLHSAYGALIAHYAKQQTNTHFIAFNAVLMATRAALLLSFFFHSIFFSLFWEYLAKKNIPQKSTHYHWLEYTLSLRKQKNTCSALQLLANVQIVNKKPLQIVLNIVDLGSYLLNRLCLFIMCSVHMLTEQLFSTRLIHDWRAFVIEQRCQNEKSDKSINLQRNETNGKQRLSHPILIGLHFPLSHAYFAWL